MPLPISNLCWGFMWIFEKGNKSTKIILVISVNIFQLLRPLQYRPNIKLYSRVREGILAELKLKTDFSNILVGPD